MPLKPFLDELPRLNRVMPINSSHNNSDEDWYEIEMRQVLHDFHAGAKSIPVWAYNGYYPGPIIEAQVGRLVKVTWTNRLPANSGFPFQVVPPLTDLADMIMAHGHIPMSEPGQAVVHLHGAHVPWESDGFPHCLLYPQDSGISPSSTIYRYPNHQQGALLWYHDHTMGITRLNVYAGLAGPYVLRDREEAALNLPGGDYEVPLIIQDRMFDSVDNPTRLVHQVDPQEQPEFFGDHIVVNGKVWPRFTVEPRKYRFRVLNGSNSRFYRLTFRPLEGTGLRPAVYQIGTDGGFLPSPVSLATAGLMPLLLSPGERADIVVDFTGCEPGDEILLANDAPAPYPAGTMPTPYSSHHAEVGTDGTVLKFVVTALKSPDESNLPGALPYDFNTQIGSATVALRHVDQVSAALEAAGEPPIRVRQHMTLTETEDKMVLLNEKGWAEPVEEEPLLNSVEIWEIDNLTGDTHPIHLHLIQFLLLDRSSLNGNSPRPIEPTELGWKDTLRCHPGERTRIIAHFTDYSGWYVWHCHMLEHEDHDMMRPMYVRIAGEEDGIQPPRPRLPG